MLRRRQFLCAALGCCGAALSGCSPGGFYGRYIVLNSSQEQILDFNIAVRDAKTNWPVTEPGQGWVVEALNADMLLHVQWTAADKEQKQTVDFKTQAGYRCQKDLVLEICKDGNFRWRLVEGDGLPA